jgi:hypothetical protein
VRRAECAEGRVCGGQSVHSHEVAVPVTLYRRGLVEEIGMQPVTWRRELAGKIEPWTAGRSLLLEPWKAWRSDTLHFGGVSVQL